MDIFILIFEIIGTVSFAVSGAMTGLRKNMDIFGVCILGLTTAVGGGIVRDLILGITPPATFLDPMYAAIAIGSSVIIFIPAIRHLFMANHRLYDIVMLVTDAAGLGIFTVYGVGAAIDAGFHENRFLVVFVAAVTGVGGGVLRDIFAGDRPYIFIKHVYACAAIAGAILCTLMWDIAGRNISMIAGFSLVTILRLCAAYFHWSLPKAREFNIE